ncbi:MAG: DUF1902 domain-containing protein [Burkholderiaceae bacterium]|jgi:hypothetical protein|nr:DUF1902 domain-containing protein [Burkholderiaceae bacterium]
MSNVVSLSQPVTFDVTVTHAIARDANDRSVWVAECDALHLVTEAETYEGLVNRVWEVMPDLVEVNGLSLAPTDVRLRFSHVEIAPQLLAM